MSLKRNFPDWLSAYYDYARDGFCPDAFHKWTGVSVISGALGRKVWLPWTSVLNHYPNMYLLMIAHPGVGKSSACNIGVDFLRKLDDMQFVPTQITVAKLIECLQESSSFSLGPITVKHSSGYYYASEASNSLKDVYESIIPAFTDFYDCPTIWERATKKDGVLRLQNVCFNMLAASTFNFLGKLISEESIMGGFASRLIYIVHDEKIIREPKWGDNGSVKDIETEKHLLEDLSQIHKLAGEFRADEDFKRLWLKWFPEFDKKRQDMESEKMQSLMVRKSTNLFKLCMIQSASESNDLVLKAKHWEKSMEMLDKVEKGLPRLLRLSQAQNTKTQAGLVQAIIHCVHEAKGKCTPDYMYKKLTVTGYEKGRIDNTMATLMGGEKSLIEMTMVDGNTRLSFNGNPDNYL